MNYEKCMMTDASLRTNALLGEICIGHRIPDNSKS
jgi:hypothetical protein